MSEEEPERQGIEPASIVHERKIYTPHVFVSAQRDWLIEGYRQALERFTAAADTEGAPTEATFCPLFEALNWAVSIQDYEKAKGRPLKQPVVRALRFVRNRVHHHWAAALDLRKFEVSSGAGPLRLTGWTFEWFWRPPEGLPPGRSGGEQQYRELLAGKPVREALEAFEKLLSAHEPDAT